MDFRTHIDEERLRARNSQDCTLYTLKRDLKGQDHIKEAWTYEDLTRAREMAAEKMPDPCWQQNEAVLSWRCAASVHIALELGLSDIGKALLLVILRRAKRLDKVLRHDGAFCVLDSMPVWKMLSGGCLRVELGISALQVSNYVDEVLPLLEKRLLDGPVRPLRSKSILELCRILNEKCLERKRLGSYTGALTFSKETLPESFLKSSASEFAIGTVEEQLKGYGFKLMLPPDFEAFYEFSNGMYAHDRKDDGTELFRPVENLDFQKDGGGLQLRLLPVQALDTYKDIDWPPLGPCIKIGGGGCDSADGDSRLLLVGPDQITKGLIIFLKAYRAAAPSDRRKLERHARDLYGGMDKMLALESVVVRVRDTYHGPRVVDSFGGFRGLLEATTAAAIADDDEFVLGWGD